MKEGDIVECLYQDKRDFRGAIGVVVTVKPQLVVRWISCPVPPHLDVHDTNGSLWGKDEGKTFKVIGHAQEG